MWMDIRTLHACGSVFMFDKISQNTLLGSLAIVHWRLRLAAGGPSQQVSASKAGLKHFLMVLKALRRHNGPHCSITMC
jgi:hypothetical protein